MKKSEFRILLKQIKKMEDVPEFLISTGLNNNLCELGVFAGNGIDLLAKSNPKLLIGIDVWIDDGNPTVTDSMSQKDMDRNYNLALEVQKFHPCVEYIKDYTTNCVKIFKDGYFDFIYVDADHSYEGCKKDMIEWWPKVKKGGILAGHDYFKAKASYEFGVIKAVDEFRFENKIDDKDFHVTPEIYAPSWFIIKN